MGSLSSKNKNVKYLLCAIDVFTKYAWIKPLKDKKGYTVINACIEVVNESNCKPKKLLVDQARKFCNKIKDLNREKMIGSFYEKELLSKL